VSIYKEATEHFGVNTQMLQTIEECSELITAISHFRRKRNNALINLREEVADVYIMLKQMMHMLDMHDNCEEVNDKLQRLKARIDFEKTERDANLYPTIQC
jgi:NTP pyrophosphatase (non-canonical NTP hydrolase)